MFDRPDSGDRAVLVHIDVAKNTPDRSLDIPDLSLQRAEFKELAESAGLSVEAMVTGTRNRPHPRHFIGQGKIDEIRLLLQSLEVDVVLFGQKLMPSQERNLERELKVRVLDRNSLILDIFAQRARSFEGKLQVELAQLVHLSTRLVRGWTHLERQKGGIGLRGPGETQLETDRRLLNERVKVLKKRLTKVRQQRQQGRNQRSRSGIQSVALVGYTNAGKSTLFNRLTTESVYVADQLFATLDPTLRRLELSSGIAAVLADTVGFISDLPHELVDAFRSTLVETRDADLLLHVVDVSDDEQESRIRDVDEVLGGIGASSTPQLRVYNKIDVKGQAPQVQLDDTGRPEAVWLSAVSGEGIDLLLEAIATLLSGRRVVGWLQVSAANGRLRSQLYSASAVLEEDANEDGSASMHIDMDAVDFARLASEYELEQNFVPDEVEPITSQRRLN